MYARGAPELGNRDAIRILALGLLGAPLLLVVAGIVDDPTVRVAIWIAALALDYDTPYIRDVSGFRISATHFAGSGVEPAAPLNSSLHTSRSPVGSGGSGGGVIGAPPVPYTWKSQSE